MLELFFTSNMQLNKPYFLNVEKALEVRLGSHLFEKQITGFN
jgi:hypothetical protein